MPPHSPTTLFSFYPMLLLGLVFILCGFILVPLTWNVLLTFPVTRTWLLCEDLPNTMDSHANYTMRMNCLFIIPLFILFACFTLLSPGFKLFNRALLNNPLFFYTLGYLILAMIVILLLHCYSKKQLGETTNNNLATKKNNKQNVIFYPVLMVFVYVTCFVLLACAVLILYSEFMPLFTNVYIQLFAEFIMVLLVCLVLTPSFRWQLLYNVIILLLFLYGIYIQYILSLNSKTL